ncbi:MAG: DNA polymerase III subunit beta [Elusimicrobiota bacterium]
MKLNLKTEKFVDLLSTVLPAVSSKSNLPSLSLFHITAEDDSIQVYGTDLDIGIVSSMKTDVEKEGVVALPARQLFDMTKMIDTEKCFIKKITDNEYELSGENKNTTYTITAGNAEEFPSIPDIEKVKKTAVDTQTLCEGIDKTIISVSKDESRFILCGIYFQCKKNKLKMVSTDGRKLSYFEKELDQTGDEIQAIIPTNAINVLRKIATSDKDEVKVSLSSSENKISMQVGNTTIYSRLIEGDYPNYNQVIPEKQDKNIVLNTDQLLSATKKMLAVKSMGTEPVKYKFSDNKLVISLSATEGTGTSSIPVEYKGEEIEISFNPDFIINILKVINSDKIKLSLTSPINPGKITPESSDENYIGVIMPMRPSQA